MTETTTVAETTQVIPETKTVREKMGDSILEFLEQRNVNDYVSVYRSTDGLQICECKKYNDFPGEFLISITWKPEEGTENTYNFDTQPSKISFVGKNNTFEKCTKFYYDTDIDYVDFRQVLLMLQPACDMFDFPTFSNRNAIRNNIGRRIIKKLKRWNLDASVIVSCEDNGIRVRERYCTLGGYFTMNILWEKVEGTNKRDFDHSVPSTIIIRGCDNGEIIRSVATFLNIEEDVEDMEHIISRLRYACSTIFQRQFD